MFVFEGWGDGTRTQGPEENVWWENLLKNKKQKTEKQDVRRLIRQTGKIWGYGHNMYEGKGMPLEWKKKNRFDIFSLLHRSYVILGKLFNFSEALYYLVY